MQYDEDELIETFGVVNFMLSELDRFEIAVDHLKLQKLLFFAYGIHLSMFNEKLFPSQIQAWKLGPVVPVVYQEFKHKNGNEPITERLFISHFDDKKNEPYIPDDENHNRHQNSVRIAAGAYGYKESSHLVDIAHKEGRAWRKVYDPKRKNIAIKDADIISDFDKEDLINKMERLLKD